MITEDIIRVRQKWVLYDKKWQKLLRRARLFRYIPFIDFVFAAGSMATGDVKPSSTFYIIVGVREWRMFTARFFLIFALDLFGWRRKNLDHGEASRDTICPNHFVTRTRYALSPPHGAYWTHLYQNLVPVYGAEEKIQAFYAANAAWMGSGRRYSDDLRHAARRDSGFKKFFEKILGGNFGDRTDRFLRGPQLRRIQARLVPRAGYKPRLFVSDDELELHLDTRRIEELEEKEMAEAH